MGLTSWVTLIAIALFTWQFLGKKGHLYHISRGFLVLLLTLAVVIINTVSIPKLTWDLAFILHTSLGLVFFWMCFMAILSGWRMLKNPTPANKKLHRLFANSTGVFLLLSILAIGLIYLR